MQTIKIMLTEHLIHVKLIKKRNEDKEVLKDWIFISNDKRLHNTENNCNKR